MHESFVFGPEGPEDIEIFPIGEPGRNENFVMPVETGVFPLPDHVLFPGTILAVPLGRDRHANMVREMFKTNTPIMTVLMRNPVVQNPSSRDVFLIGTVAEIVRILEMPDGSTSVILQGYNRAAIKEFLNEKPWITARIEAFPEKPDEDISTSNLEFSATAESVKRLFIRSSELSNGPRPEMNFMLKNMDNPVFTINFAATNSRIKALDKQSILECNSLLERGNHLLELLQKDILFLELCEDIRSRATLELNQQQREYMLQQQIKTIQDELGGSPVEQEIAEFEKKAAKKLWSKEVSDRFARELEKLRRQNPAAADYSVQANYLQTLIDLPWDYVTKDNLDLNRAKAILDRDHTGLKEIKERILEYLAVLKLKGDLKSPIICLVGPPGVGKTSLGKSIAKALGRKFIRMSLGGMHDESEIRGHRKTYIGAMPGQILQHIMRAGSSNPVFVLDEVDKVGQSVNGDPSSALLEVLDPEQNGKFHDNFLDIDYDLSKVLFIATANVLDTIQPALADRMEIIRLSGYLSEEKREIAKCHLVPRQLQEHGLAKTDLSFPAKVLDYIIENYTRESGVRQLDKTIAKIIRWNAQKIAMYEPYERKLTPQIIRLILGQPKYLRQVYQGNDIPGVVTGLAWTSVGGEILSIETSLSKGKGDLTLTGNLGNVMKESAMIALEYVRSHCQSLNIDPEVFQNWNFHIHVPEGAIPKDGPSAGITMATSIASAVTKRKVRPSLAMSGEITLSGKVLPVGGIKEKILAAKRAGITEIILCDENQADIVEIDPVYIKGLNFTMVKTIEQVLSLSLL